MNTELIIYIIICTELAMGRLSAINYSFPIWDMIRFVILAPITVPIFIGSVITLIAEYANKRLHQINKDIDND